ncbi:MAG: hypothetical protein ACLQVG_31175 [Terriglobia bacterium]
MAAIGIIIGLIGAAVGILLGVVGGLVGMVFGLLGGSLALLAHLFPVLVIALGIIWLVKGSNPGKSVAARTDPGVASRPQGPRNPQ